MRGTKDNLLFLVINGHNILKSFSPTSKYLFNISLTKRSSLANKEIFTQELKQTTKTWSYLINIDGRTTILFLLRSEYIYIFIYIYIYIYILP